MYCLREGEGIWLLGVLVNLGLAGLKFWVGAVSGSVALIADGFHTLSDLVTDLVVELGMRLGMRPPDRDHPYGHGKFETLAGAVVSLVLIFVGVEIGIHSFRELLTGGGGVGLAMMSVAAFSFVAKELLYRVTTRRAARIRSPALRANAWHHRSDALSSLAVFIGGAMSSLGYPWGDGAAGITVGAVIAVSGARILWEGVHELTEGGLLQREQEAVIVAIEAVPGVKGWHRLRARRSGRAFFIDVHIHVDPDIPLREAHEIATAVERAVEGALGGEVSVTVHVEPKEEEE